MPSKRLLCVLFAAGFLYAQDGQKQGSRPGWPCVPGRAVDPTYLEVSESTGGQLFFFQRNEAAQGMVVINAPHTHPATVLRAVGNLAGDRDFEFPVDAGMKSILVMASLQCRREIRVSRPSGAEANQSTSVQFLELQAGRIQQIDLPEPGMWKVRLSGTGLFVLSVQTKADVSLGRVAVSAMRLEAHVSGQVSNVRFQVIDAAGDPVASLDAVEPDEGGAYRSPVEPPVERFRIRVTGTDASGWPFQRTYPVLFRATRR
jgi:hypothetical protein